MTTHPTRVDDLVAEMTLEEQASLTGGRDVWYLPAVERLGIGLLKMSDGPSGVRGVEMGTRRSLSFPCGLAAGATWDTELLGRFGTALGDEARSKGVHVLLGPTVCIIRTPLGGRTFESFAEDPHLAARLTAAYVRGVQSRGVASCVKHFACNDQEHERMSISAEVDERTLREVHLVPFEAAVVEAGAWAIMSAYNKVNGTYCGEHDVLLGRILKDEWGFDGVVVSDWLGTHSTVEATLAGLDVEMPGPPSFLGAKLAAAVEAGEVDGAVVTEHARRIVRLAERTGAIGATAAPEAEEDDPGRRAVARELAVAGTVLLRNDGVLPLEPATVRRVALIGPNARDLQVGGGGSSQVTPLAHGSLVEELRRRLPAAEVAVEEGCSIDRGLPALPVAILGGGLDLECFATRDLSGPPARTERLHRSSYVAIGPPAPGVDVTDFGLRATTTFTPDVTGAWELGISSTGPSCLYLDEVLVLDNREPTPGGRFFGFGSEIVSATVELVAGEAHAVRVEMQGADAPIAGVELLAARPSVGDPLARAVAAARAAEVAVVVVGSNSQWETEGEDRGDLRLVGEQDALVAAVAAVNPRTVVVVNNGGPVAMPWVDDVAAVLDVWYPGEEGAAALADVLTGVADPGGRLPVTFPRALEDTAPGGSSEWYPGTDGRVVYGEGLLVGHRHLDAHDVEPLFAFGHGLSYTTFDHGPATVAGTFPDLTVRVPVTNTGGRRGSEVVQLYVEPAERGDGRPVRHLAGFAKLALDAGQAAVAELTLGARSFAGWDPATGGWATLPGAHTLLVGTSSRNLRPAAVVHAPD
jgi:beta-glucosidase